MKKKIFALLTAIIATMITMAQSQFYVIMKDGSGASYPEDIVDSLTFDNNNGAKIYGFEDLIKRLNALETKVALLENKIGNIDEGEKQDSSFGHAYVDLGLPSGTLWATCNVGGENPEDYGMYFAWGDKEPKNIYTKSEYEFSCATLGAAGIIDSKYNLTEDYDAATIFWGNGWSTPNKEEAEELIKNCSSSWTEQNGINGILFVGPNGNKLFLPVAGMKKEEEAQVGVRGYYMLATATDDEINCNYLYLDQEKANLGSSRRSHGRTIRAVIRKSTQNSENLINGHEFVDLGLPSGMLWATQNLGAAKTEETGELYMWGALNPGEHEDEYLGEMKYDEMLAQHIIDEDGTLALEYDAANSQWGDRWRMPTIEDFTELINNCEFYEAQLNGLLGITVAGPNGNRIFLPMQSDRRNEFNKPITNYWSSTFHQIDIENISFTNSAQSLYIQMNEKIGSKLYDYNVKIDPQKKRSAALPIRPVAPRLKK